ncbi:hypothetical protein SAMN05192588_0447 [Nonlabens sp. Hel1_33_55]|uniref:hypothetical protein n=1 Tax=Nonlabens sp. Hel1_33_55 TaxID=1336802 RepID=UPI000875CBB1|nr:hypothetical protein [Nonlabens sp. Hel1_33_55]SCX96089.1 hypothetical protein SAMN05192588_0447 [Nonlabens sp. Hel1_33_55]
MNHHLSGHNDRSKRRNEVKLSLRTDLSNKKKDLVEPNKLGKLQKTRPNHINKVITNKVVQTNRKEARLKLAIFTVCSIIVISFLYWLMS